MSTHLVKGTGQVLVADNVCVFMEPYNESAHIISSPMRHQYRQLHEPWAFVESPKVHLPLWCYRLRCCTKARGTAPIHRSVGDLALNLTNASLGGAWVGRHSLLWTCKKEDTSSGQFEEDTVCFDNSSNSAGPLRSTNQRMRDCSRQFLCEKSPGVLTKPKNSLLFTSSLIHSSPHVVLGRVSSTITHMRSFLSFEHHVVPSLKADSLPGPSFSSGGARRRATTRVSGLNSAQF